jgi:hypothetical protein
MEIDIYDLQNINSIIIDYPDIYFTPEYGKLCEYSDNGKWEIAIYKDLIYPYIKILQPDNTYKLLSPYGYSGIYFKKNETYIEFIKKWKLLSIKKKFLLQIIKQNPYIFNNNQNINIIINISEYNIKLKIELIKNKTIFGIKFNNVDEYFMHVKNSVKNKIKKAIKNNFSYEILKINNNLHNYEYSIFRKYYNDLMLKLNSDKYYFFNNNYFNYLKNIKNTKLLIIKNENKEIIGTTIIFEYKEYIHYHLSCHNYSCNTIGNYIFYSLINIYPNKLIIIGGGLEENDSLCIFKKNNSNISLNYNIYKISNKINI